MRTRHYTYVQGPAITCVAVHRWIPADTVFWVRNWAPYTSNRTDQKVWPVTWEVYLPYSTYPQHETYKWLSMVYLRVPIEITEISNSLESNQIINKYIVLNYVLYVIKSIILYS